MLNSSTRRLLIEEGFLYYCDYSGDDLPRIEVIDGKKIVANPFQFEVDDIHICVRGGAPPQAFFDVFKRTFDWMYAEGAYRPGILTVSVHATLFGRPFGV